MGILLFVGFFPMIGESAEEMSDDYSGSDFEDYSEGDRVFVYGMITRMDIKKDTTVLVLDGQTDVPITVDGNLSGHFREGQSIYVRCTVKEIGIGGFVTFEYLTAHPYDVHNEVFIQAIFALIAISGLLIVVVAVVKKV